MDKTLIISRLKLSLNLNDTQFADRLGVSKQTISSWKSRNSIDFDKIFALCESEGLSIDWLLTGKGSMYREEGARQIVNGSGNQAIGGSTINVSESEIEYYRKRVSELEKLVEQKDKVIDVLSGK